MQIEIYSDNIEAKALDQFYKAIKEPFTEAAALMPDAHFGYSLPIGAVVATRGVVVPSWVGYDIGCGMCAVKTNLKRNNIKPGLGKEILAKTPVGFNHHKEVQAWDYSNCTNFLSEILATQKQLGSLGGGNHFIEIGYDESDSVWVVVHSGSRNVGHTVASRYMKLASNSHRAKEGNYALEVDSVVGRQYIRDMTCCLAFALENRKRIVINVLEILGAKQEAFINRNHNHAEFKDGLWIHRKGATQAEEGMLGVIPGNMRDGSFIVEGKGNKRSLCSSSHGAGRVLGRRAAKSILKLEDFEKTMQGIEANISLTSLDESPMAYKDIFQVMKEQEDLVDVIAYIKPLVNVKG